MIKIKLNNTFFTDFYKLDLVSLSRTRISSEEIELSLTFKQLDFEKSAKLFNAVTQKKINTIEIFKNETSVVLLTNLKNTSLFTVEELTNVDGVSCLNIRVVYKVEESGTFVETSNQ